jgi:hypothetical protein
MVVMKQNIMENKQNPPEGNPKKVVAIVLDEQSIMMAKKMVVVREAESLSAYMRRLVRDDHRKETRRQLRQEQKG